MFSLGERPERRYAEAHDALARLGYASIVDYLVDACRLVLDNTNLVPHVNAGTLTLDEIARLREVSGSMGMMLENVSRRLTWSGMAHHACPDKAPLLRLRTIEATGRLGIPLRRLWVSQGELLSLPGSHQELAQLLCRVSRPRDARAFEMPEPGAAAVGELRCRDFVISQSTTLTKNGATAVGYTSMTGSGGRCEESVTKRTSWKEM